MNKTAAVTIPDDCNGERLDRTLGRLFPEHSRNYLARLITEGRVSVDTEPVSKASHRVATGQVVEIAFPPPTATETISQDIPLHIVFEDESLAVIDKPAGMVVHPAAGNREGTLVNALLFHVRDLSGIGGEIRPGIVHRIDKDTSGLLVIAKNDAVHRHLSEAWNTAAVRKEYLGIVYGTPRVEEGAIDAPIGRDPGDRKRMAVVTGGRRALTSYTVVERLKHTALLRFRLATGRTHQIRVHAKHLGHPLVGDPVYAGPQWRGIPDPQVRSALSAMTRQALHAAVLAFPHPKSGEPMRFESPLPDDMASLLRTLRVKGSRGDAAE